MAKFNVPGAYNQAQTQVPTGYLVSEPVASGVTHEGALGFARDAKSELFLFAVSDFVEDTFYENKDARADRYRALVHAVAVTDPEWLTRFLAWLRNDGNMRSASVSGGLEAAAAMLKAKIPGARAIVNSVLQRADEPGEALAFWVSRYGRKLPKPVKRGIADAARRLYNEFSLLRYDTATKGYRFADVLELTHPSVSAPWQGDLYKFALARRHNRAEIVDPDALPMVAYNMVLRETVAGGNYDRLLDTEALKRAGFTWEDTLSLAGDRVDKAKLWEALIPTMGYMALLRNLANFDRAGISVHAAASVMARLANAEQVAKSKQFPFRFLSAYRAVGSLQWGQALEVALNLSLSNVPVLPGSTLILVDRSGSMFDRASARSELTRADQAAVFGTALALRNVGRATLVQFGTTAHRVPVAAGDSLLRVVNERFRDLGGTNTQQALQMWYQNHDRVVLITDEQAFGHGDRYVGATVPETVPSYTWNLAGYKYGHAPTVGRRYTFGGLTDQAFNLIQFLERGESQTWPF